MGCLHFIKNFNGLFKMKKLLLFKTLFFNVLLLNAQNQDSIKTADLGEIIISANKVAENKNQVAQPINILTKQNIELLNPQNAADLLALSGNAVVQKSQQGGGSPILRGFEASRVLLMVDGVRMNNLIYRAGHLQNIITLDPSILDRVEILYGPASTVYGSDALGGVMHFYTRKPPFSADGMKMGGNASARYGSVNQEKTVHADLNFGWKNFAMLSSLTYSDFGDLTMGKNTQALDTLWGLRKFYAERINGKDSLVANTDPYLQKSTGYKQYDFLQKIAYQQNEHIIHLLNIQFSNSTNIPRYDRLTDPKGVGLNSAEWYYGPQKRLLTAYELNMIDLNGFFNHIKLNINYQDVEESRHNRNFGATFKNSRIEKVNVYGANVDFYHTKEAHQFRTGLDAQYGTAKSTAFKINVNDNMTAAQSTRYPDGDNYQQNVAIYATHTWKMNEQLVLNDGLRAGSIRQKSTFVDKTFYPFPYNEAVQNMTGLSGNLGLIYTPSPILRVSALGSTGYKVPNVDDLAKVFESAKGTVIVPNPNIKPEKTYNLDIGFVVKDDKILWENNIYFTKFVDAIVADKFQFNGQDSIVYDGVKSQVLANQNKNEARLWGFSSALKVHLCSGLTFAGTYHYTQGRIIKADNSRTPLDHIPPANGRLSLQYVKNQLFTEFFINYSDWKQVRDYFLNGEDNEQYATKSGMPSWWTMNARVSYEVAKGLKLQIGIDNIADVQYRVFASGIHGAGRNLFGTVRYSF
jgi:hemoglobin/transferrin/lactoferrin receptor protein